MHQNFGERPHRGRLLRRCQAAGHHSGENEEKGVAPTRVSSRLFPSGNADVNHDDLRLPRWTERMLVTQVWVNVGDIVLLGLRDFQDTKADVIVKFMPDEARQLQKQGVCDC